MRAFLQSVIAPVLFVTLVGVFGPAPVHAGNSDYSGEYFLPSGKRVSVFEQGILASMARLMFINNDNSRTGALVPGEPDHFVTPFSAAPSESLATTLNFERGHDGSVVALVIQEPGAASMRAERRETFRETPAHFKNGDAVLAGTLKTPLGSGPFPAIVLIHGAGGGVGVFAVQLSFVKLVRKLPRKLLPPDLVIALTIPPVKWPYSAGTPPVMTVVS